MLEWTNLILEVGSEHGYLERPEIVQTEDCYLPGYSDVEELLVGYEKLHGEAGWEPQIEWSEGVRRTID